MLVCHLQTKHLTLLLMHNKKTLNYKPYRRFPNKCLLICSQHDNASIITMKQKFEKLMTFTVDDD